jgi:hypothetical protein
MCNYICTLYAYVVHIRTLRCIVSLSNLFMCCNIPKCMLWFISIGGITVSAALSIEQPYIYTAYIFYVGIFWIVHDRKRNGWGGRKIVDRWGKFTWTQYERARKITVHCPESWENYSVLPSTSLTRIIRLQPTVSFSSVHTLHKNNVLKIEIWDE